MKAKHRTQEVNYGIFSDLGKLKKNKKKNFKVMISFVKRAFILLLIKSGMLCFIAWTFFSVQGNP